MIPGFKLVRRLLFSLAIFGLLFIAGNLVAERVAEGKLGDIVRSEFGLSARPTIDIDAFPVVWSAVKGTIAHVSFDARDITVQDLRVRLLEVDLRDLTAPGGLLAGIPASLSVGRVHAVAEVDAAAVNAFLRAQNEDATVRLREGAAVVTARRRIAGRMRTIEARGTLRIRSGVLTFVPRNVTVDGEPPRGFDEQAKREATVRAELPDLPGDLRIDSLEVHAGYIRFVSDAQDTTLSLAGGEARLG